MDFLNEQGLQTLTNELVKAENIKFKSHRGDTVKKVIDNITRECEDVKNPYTMTLENKISSFKVGKNKDIDVSTNVETSKVEVELKGKTYQNLCGSNVFAGIQYKDDYQSENTEEYLKTTRIADNNNGWFYYCNKALKVTMLKPDTFYTIFFRYDSNNNRIPDILFAQGNTAEGLSSAVMSTNLRDDIYRCVVKTIPSFEGKKIKDQVVYFHNSAPKRVGEYTTIYKKMLVLEGDYSDLSIEEIPKYFTEIKSSFENEVVDIEVQGKNLFDTSKLTQFTNNNVSIACVKDKLLLSGIANHSWTSFTTANTLSKGTYFLRIFNKGVFWGYNAKIWGRNSKGELIANVSNGHKFVVEEDIVSIQLVIQGYTTGSAIDAEVTVQIEKALESTNYEPYYKNRVSFNIEEPLRSLPDGTCDEIRNNNGKWELVRRIGKKIINGTEENIVLNGSSDIHTQFVVHNVIKTAQKTSHANLVCNTKPVLPNNGGNNSIWMYVGKMLVFQMQNGMTLEAFREWLKQNPATIYYELEVPTITSIEPLELDIKPLATMTIASDIAPTSNHKVVLNKAGQIEQGIIQVAELRKRINNLETAYDSYLLETQHKLSILDFEYELESEDED